jgi:hypothetical protein
LSKDDGNWANRVLSPRATREEGTLETKTQKCEINSPHLREVEIGKESENIKANRSGDDRRAPPPSRVVVVGEELPRVVMDGDREAMSQLDET